MTNERHHELSQQIHEALAEGCEEKVKGLQLTLELEMAECLAHQSERGKETLSIVKTLRQHSDERDDCIERKLEEHLAEYKENKARIDGAKKGANFALAILKELARLLAIGGSAGATVKALSAFAN